MVAEDIKRHTEEIIVPVLEVQRHMMAENVEKSLLMVGILFAVPISGMQS